MPYRCCILGFLPDTPPLEKSCSPRNSRHFTSFLNPDMLNIRGYCVKKLTTWRSTADENKIILPIDYVLIESAIKI